MVNLGIKVLENYTIQDVLGENPPTSKSLEDDLSLEVSKLIQGLDKKSRSELQEILSNNILAKKELTKFSGAQAMDQSKIEMFHDFLAKYIEEIESRLAKS